MNDKKWNILLSLQGNNDVNVVPTNNVIMSSKETISVRLKSQKIGDVFPKSICKDILILGAIGSEMSVFRENGYNTSGVSLIGGDVGNAKDNYNESIILCDFHDLSCFSANSFDGVYSYVAFEHCLAPLCVLMECRRVLRGNGRLLFSVPTADMEIRNFDKFPGYAIQHYCLLDKEIWNHLLRLTGFSIMHSKQEDNSYAEFLSFKDSVKDCPGKFFEQRLREVNLW